MNGGRRWLKRIGIGLGVLVGLLLLAAIIIPLVVKVDDYRPQIVSAANEKLNGKLDLGKLTLTMWGQIRVGVDGFSLKDSQSRDVVAAKDVFIAVPWLSLLSGSPRLTFTMNAPEVNVVKDKNGKLNVLTLMKTDTTQASPEVPGAPAPAPKGEPMKIPGIAARARLGMEMRNAHLSYKDLKTALNSEVKDLNVILKDVSLSHPTEMEISAHLDTRMGKNMTVKGPVNMTGKGEPVFEGGNYKQTILTMNASFNDLEILMPELFEKKKGVPANMEGKIAFSPEAVHIENLALKFFAAEIKATGGVTALGTEAQAMNLKFSSNEIPLKPWSELVPMLKAYELNGTATLEGDANAAGEKIAYRAVAAVKALTMKTPTLKAQPQIDATIKVVTDQIESLRVGIKAPGSQLDITGKMVSFTKPNLTLDVRSPGMDLDQLIEFPKSAAAGGAAKGDAKGGGSSTTPPADFDKMLDPMRENQIAKDAVALVRVKMDSLKAYNAKMTNIDGQLTFKGLTATLDRFSMGLFNGTVKATSAFQLAPKAPTYHITADASKVDLKQAVTSQFELFKNTLMGIASMKFEGTGASLNPEPAKKNLNVKGNMRVEQATFATMDIGKIAVEAINKAATGVASKVPGFNGKGLNPPQNIDSKYESVTSDFTISGGVFNSPNFFAKAMPNRGLDIRGNTSLNIVDYGLKAEWEIIDTYNLTQAKNLSVDIAGSNVPHILTEGDQPLKLPIRVSGNAFSPNVSYTDVPEALAKVAMKNVQSAAESRVKAEVQKKAEEAGREALKGLGKKLFGN